MCIRDRLYWDFLDRHREEFKGNHRIAQQLFGLNRLKDLDEVRSRAKDVLKKLDQGKL